MRRLNREFGGRRIKKLLKGVLSSPHLLGPPGTCCSAKALLTSSSME